MPLLLEKNRSFRLKSNKKATKGVKQDIITTMTNNEKQYRIPV